MNDKECEDVYHQLVSMLSNQHMEWVVQEAEERINREQLKPLHDISDIDHEQLTLFGDLNALQKASPPKKISVAKRRLVTLIDEIDHAVIHPAECRQFLFRFLHRKEIREVIFLSPNGDGRKLVLEKDSIQEQRLIAKKLGHILHSLRDAVVQEA
ncbi:hypothetical protein [Ktedonobacter robiniae]|uniref:Uncharacterized protein n=1 Tax=Ktedonobacter robiniae TaxID=2778365 RepID=A0ABQ3V2J4_9CHLR|nr:hypothetical protein [Ktedonobacter robiniae]GHO59198.1 hypothetical protein KSB_76730 [Ktedonobacter robiniae]